jgi:hypothetical protein
MKVDQIPIKWKLITVPLLRTRNKISHIPVSGEQDIGSVLMLTLRIQIWTNLHALCFLVRLRYRTGLPSIETTTMLNVSKFLGQIPYIKCLFYFFIFF